MREAEDADVLVSLLANAVQYGRLSTKLGVSS
jgi:hypothetical protein